MLRTDPALAEAFMARLAHQLPEIRGRMDLRNIRSVRDRVLRYLRLRTAASSRLRATFRTSRRKIGMTHEALYRPLAALEADRVCEPHGECDSVEEIR